MTTAPAPAPTAHWHAYAWTGHERPPDSDRTRPENPVPPLEIAHWLRKPARHVLATYGVDQADQALAWLRSELEKHPRPERDLPADVQMEYSADCLRRLDDVVWGYYAGSGRYISRALIACPRRGVDHCPYGA
ncbi:MAG TPA: hypothetical protein VFY14_07075 [Streptomyces sp.]|nr:hypothetical protein [Streptomyces sp.]